MAHIKLASIAFGILAAVGILEIDCSTASSAPRHHVTKSSSEDCQALEAEYDDASRALALNAALNGADDSAARTAMRNNEDAATMQKAQLTLELMRGHSCELPTSAPSAARYDRASTKCQNDLVVAKLDAQIQAQLGSAAGLATPPSCDTRTWLPDAR
jgi:hypothetical protein